MRVQGKYKEFIKNIFENNPELREYIASGNWGRFWAALDIEGIEIDDSLYNGLEMYISISGLMYLSLLDAGIDPHINTIPVGFFYTSDYTLGKIVLPNSVEKLDDGAFDCCDNLTSIELPNSLKVIGDTAFYGCPRLKKIVIPNSVVKIGKAAFDQGYIESITLPKKFEENINQLFNFPDGTTIDDWNIEVKYV